MLFETVVHVHQHFNEHRLLYQPVQLHQLTSQNETIPNDIAMPASPPHSTSTASSIVLVNSATTNNIDDQPKNSNNPSPIILNSSSINVDKNGTKPSDDIDGLLEENKSLRGKNLA